MQLKQIAFTEFEVKFTGDVATIEGYASTFGNVDSDNDIVIPGAFKDSIAKRMPKMLYQHKSDKLPGVWEKAAEDTKGLILVGKTLNTTLGRDVAEEVRSGAIDTLSIGYTPTKASFDKGTNTRRLEKLTLFETSLVTFPANDQAVITRVKSENGMFMTDREFEEFLRDVGGLSPKEAKTVVSKGYRAIAGQRDASPEVSSIVELLNQFKP